MNIFEGLDIENIEQCPNLNYGSGLQAHLYYAPVIYFQNINLPNNDGDFQEIISISNKDIVFKPGFNWGKIDILIDENELKLSVSGANKRKKTKSNLDIYIPGMRAKTIGFIEKFKNIDMVFCISNTDGTSYLIGNLRNFANISNSDATTGKKYEDNSGLSVSINCNSPIYLFNETYITENNNVDGGFIDITMDF